MKISKKSLFCVLAMTASVDAFSTVSGGRRSLSFGIQRMPSVPRSASSGKLLMVAGGASAYEQEMYDGMCIFYKNLVFFISFGTIL